jgi:hypothetical protein
MSALEICIEGPELFDKNSRGCKRARRLVFVSPGKRHTGDGQFQLGRQQFKDFVDGKLAEPRLGNSTVRQALVSGAR